MGAVRNWVRNGAEGAFAKFGVPGWDIACMISMGCFPEEAPWNRRLCSEIPCFSRSLYRLDRASRWLALACAFRNKLPSPEVAKFVRPCTLLCRARPRFNDFSVAQV